MVQTIPELIASPACLYFADYFLFVYVKDKGHSFVSLLKKRFSEGLTMRFGLGLAWIEKYHAAHTRNLK